MHYNYRSLRFYLISKSQRIKKWEKKNNRIKHNYNIHRKRINLYIITSFSQNKRKIMTKVMWFLCVLKYFFYYFRMNLVAFRSQAYCQYFFKCRMFISFLLIFDWIECNKRKSLKNQAIDLKFKWSHLPQRKRKSQISLFRLHSNVRHFPTHCSRRNTQKKKQTQIHGNKLYDPLMHRNNHVAYRRECVRTYHVWTPRQSSKIFIMCRIYDIQHERFMCDLNECLNFFFFTLCVKS